MRQQKPPVAVQHLQLAVVVWDDLAEKSVHPHIADEPVPECLLFVLVEQFEAIDGRLQMALHLGVVRRPLPIGGL